MWGFPFLVLKTIKWKKNPNFPVFKHTQILEHHLNFSPLVNTPTSSVQCAATLFYYPFLSST